MPQEFTINGQATTLKIVIVQSAQTISSEKVKGEAVNMIDAALRMRNVTR